MKTVDWTRDKSGVLVTLQLNEFELTGLVALVEEGQRRLHGKPETKDLHAEMHATADEFRSLLGHLELLSANE